jgi:pimeloyl-ACP methyl ester carboxylesterase
VTPDPAPFRVDPSAARLEDLRSRLRATRIPVDDAAHDPRFGLTADYLRSFIDYWLDEYDWPAERAAIDALPNFRVTLDGQPVHYVHVRGVGPAPMPLVLTHGWPWSFWDYRKVIGPLTDPATHGGEPRDAFDVVIPSLPGYVYSSPLRPSGASARQTAGLWDRLMLEVLGYDRYGAGGGDWGANISILLGHEYAHHLTGIYVTLPNVSASLRNRFEPFRLDELDGEERDWYVAHYRDKLPDGQTYVPPNTANFTRPHNEAYPGYDSPLALAVKVLEARLRSGDTGGNVESVFSRRELVTNVMLYWLTDTWPSAHRLYWHSVRDRIPEPATDRPLVTVPTGVGLFPAEVLYVPRARAARDVDLKLWSYHSAGGHFAACEQPAAFVDDVRALFRDLR